MYFYINKYDNIFALKKTLAILFSFLIAFILFRISIKIILFNNNCNYFEYHS